MTKKGAFLFEAGKKKGTVGKVIFGRMNAVDNWSRKRWKGLYDPKGGGRGNPLSIKDAPNSGLPVLTPFFYMEKRGGTGRPLSSEGRCFARKDTRCRMTLILDDTHATNEWGPSQVSVRKKRSAGQKRHSGC